MLGGTHGSLAAARSLGRRGIPVWLLVEGNTIARYSRYVRRIVPWPEADDEKLTARLLQLGELNDLRGWTLFAGADEEAAFLARRKAELQPYFRVFGPGWDQMRSIYDKRETYELARFLGIDHPWTCCPGSREELAALDCPFPAILKPAVKPDSNPFTQAKAWKVSNREQLLARYDEACQCVGARHVLVQELIPGNGDAQYAYGALWWEGRPVAELVARRTRQFPVDFGYTSTFVETLPEGTEIEETARRYLRALSFTGLVEVEFKRDARNGRYKLLDVNGRFWQWLSLGARAGVDLPYLAWLAASGKPPKPSHGRPGVHWVHATRDLASVASSFRRGTIGVGDYLRTFRPRLACAVAAWDDPFPMLIDPLLALNGYWKRRHKPHAEFAPQQRLDRTSSGSH